MTDLDMKTLVIVPCGKSKIWDKNPAPQFVKAKEAYTGTYFSLNRKYAEKFGDGWIILSAKYGFINPDTMIENYDISFNSKKTNPISTEILKNQIKNYELSSFGQIIGLGGQKYRDRISKSFAEYQIEIIFPFENCSGIGDMQRKIKETLKF